MAQEAELSVEDLRNLAQKLDTTGQVDLEDPSSETEDRESESADSSTVEVETKEPTQDELEEADKESAERDGAESSDTSEAKTKDQKETERFDRNWKKLEERRTEVERKEKELAEREKQASKTKDVRDEIDTDGYSVKDYEFAAKKFRDEGDNDLAVQAEQKAKSLYYHAFQNAWRSNMNEMIDQYPDLSDSRKPFTIACDKVLEALPFLKTIPEGCKYAVRIARGDTSDSLISELKAENGKLKKEVERFQKATRLSGSLPNKLPQGKTFDTMSSDERFSYLRDMADAADRGEY